MALCREMFETIDAEHAELIVAMDNQVATGCATQLLPKLPLERLVCWRIKDPYGDSLTSYCAKSIYAEMKRLPIVANKS